MVSKYRSSAQDHLKRALKLKASEDDVDLRYAALELRMCIEALCYEIFEQYTHEVPIGAFDKWQPKKILDELVKIDADVSLSKTISIFPHSKDGAPSKTIELGTLRRFSVNWANKHHNKLGSVLHEPTLRQEVKRPFNRQEALSKIEQVIPELEAVLSGNIQTFRAHRLVWFDCNCGQPIARDLEFLLDRKPVICSDCGREFNYKQNDDSSFRFDERKATWVCEKCEGPHEMLFHEVVNGVEIFCADCGAAYKIVQKWMLEGVGKQE